MRPLLVLLSVLCAAPVWAEGGQAEDDETPGARGGAQQKRRSDEPVDSDTPEQPSEPARQPKAGVVGEKSIGDSPLRLNGPVDPSHPEGVYAGVSIGSQNLPPHPPRLPLKGPARMTWPGFQVRDGVPTVFLQTTGTPNYAVTETPGAIRVVLRGTKIQLRNNRRPLKVAEFGTNVTEIAAAQRGSEVVVTIKHKGEAGHRERVEPSTTGLQLLVVEVPGK